MTEKKKSAKDKKYNTPEKFDYMRKKETQMLKKIYLYTLVYKNKIKFANSVRFTVDLRAERNHILYNTVSMPQWWWKKETEREKYSISPIIYIFSWDSVVFPFSSFSSSFLRFFSPYSISSINHRDHERIKQTYCFPLTHL